MRVAVCWSLSVLLIACVGDLPESGPQPDGGAVTGGDGGSRPVDAAAGAPDAGPDATPTLYDLLAPAEREVFDLINQERTSRGLVAVTLRDTLVCAAARHSDDIGATHLCTHTGSDLSGPGDRVEDCGGGGWSGEIVACGYTTARAAVDGWLGSPGHRAIMLSASKREVGVAMTDNYWTAIFDD